MQQLLILDAERARAELQGLASSGLQGVLSAIPCLTLQAHDGPHSLRQSGSVVPDMVVYSLCRLLTVCMQYLACEGQHGVLSESICKWS